MNTEAGSRSDKVVGSTNPFKLLDPYTQKDRLFGRDGDVVLVVARIASARTTLLFSGTGIGKTSFLQAKLIPHLDRDYQIVFFSRWTGDRPATDLRQAVLTQLGLTDLRGWSARERVREALGKSSRDRADVVQDATTPFLEDEPTVKPVLLVLDQFEELFQRGGSDRRAKKCAGQIAWLVRKFPVRVVIAMREEYLGELSVFDNRVADLFDNHYRLKRPTKAEAGSIIRQTAGICNAPVAADRLDELVKDLSRLRPTLGSETDHASVPTEFVSPPFLQISCYRMWEDEQPTAERPFLSTYERGRAARELEVFCGEQLRRLGFWRRQVVSRCFEFLVDRRGAKVAYDSKLLARLVWLPASTVRKALDRLTETRTRILRRRQVNGNAWYELYHDVYAPVVQQWSDKHRWWRRWVVLPLAFSACILTTYLASMALHDRSLVVQLRADNTPYEAAKSARVELETSPLRALTRLLIGSPKALWARYVEGRAKQAQRDENRSLALLLLDEAARSARDDGKDWSRYAHEFALIAPESMAALVSTYYSGESLPRDERQFVINAAGSQAVKIDGAPNHEVLVHLLDGRFMLWRLESGTSDPLLISWNLQPTSERESCQFGPVSASAGAVLADAGTVQGIRNPPAGRAFDYQNVYDSAASGVLKSPPISAFVTVESTRGSTESTRGSTRFFAGSWSSYDCAAPPQAHYSVLIWDEKGSLLTMDRGVTEGLSGKSQPAVAFSNQVPGASRTGEGPLLGVFWSQNQLLRTFAIDEGNQTSEVNTVRFPKDAEGLGGVSSWTFIGNDRLAVIDSERKLKVFTSIVKDGNRSWSGVCQAEPPDSSTSRTIHQSRMLATEDGRVAAFIETSEPQDPYRPVNEIVLWDVPIDGAVATSPCHERSRVATKFGVAGFSVRQSTVYAVSPSLDGFAEIIDATNGESVGRIPFSAADVVLPDGLRTIRFGDDSATSAEAVNMWDMKRSQGPDILARAEEADVEVLGQLKDQTFSLIARRDGGQGVPVATTFGPGAQSLRWSMTPSGRFLFSQTFGCLNIWEISAMGKTERPQAPPISADGFLVGPGERWLLGWATQSRGCEKPSTSGSVGTQVSTKLAMVYSLDEGQLAAQSQIALAGSAGLRDPVFSKSGRRIAGIVGNSVLAWELPPSGPSQTAPPIKPIVVFEWNTPSQPPLIAWAQSDVLVIAKGTSLEWHLFQSGTQKVGDTRESCLEGKIQLLGLSRNDSRLAVACGDRKIEIWDRDGSSQPQRRQIIQTGLNTKLMTLLLTEGGDDLFVQTKGWVHIFRKKDRGGQLEYLLGRPVGEGARIVVRNGVYGFVDGRGVVLGELEQVPKDTDEAIRKALAQGTISLRLGQSLAGDGKLSPYNPNRR